MAGPVGVRRRKQDWVIVVLGAGLLLLGSIGLFWNEWRSAGTIATLTAGERSVVSVGPDRVPGDVAGRLVHVAGMARPGGTAQDPLLPVGRDVLRLDRIVEMFQWRELSEGSGDNRRTRHERVWAEGRIASERFRERVGRTNPPAPSIASEPFQPAEVTLGAFGVAPELVALLPAGEAIVVPDQAVLFVDGKELIGGGTAFHSGDPGSPAIGDIRIRYRTVPAGEISVLAGLDGSVLRPWTAPDGGRIALVEPGLRTAQAMLGAAHRANALRGWGIRAGGALALFVGVSLLLHAARRRRPALVAFAAPLGKSAAITLALAWALVVVALAWALFRPLMSLGLVALGGALYVGGRLWGGRSRGR